MSTQPDPIRARQECVEAAVHDRILAGRGELSIGGVLLLRQVVAATLDVVDAEQGGRVEPTPDARLRAAVWELLLIAHPRPGDPWPDDTRRGPGLADNVRALLEER